MDQDILLKPQRTRFRRQETKPDGCWLVRRIDRATQHRSRGTLYKLRHHCAGYIRHRDREFRQKQCAIYIQREKDDSDVRKRTFMDD